MRKFLVGVVLLLAGCGYTTGSVLPSNFHTLFVEPFQNKVQFVNEEVRGSYIPLLETKARTAIIDRFQLDGHLRLNDSNQSDLILKGNLIGFERDDLRTDDNQNVQEYRVRVIVALTMLNNATGEVFWEEPYFAGEASYFISGAQAKTESQAINDALTDLSRRVVERTIENW